MKIHETIVKVDLKTLKGEIIPKLRENYNNVGAQRENKQGRSAFSALNNISKFCERVDTGTDSVELKVEGTVEGSTARVYYKPSITSLAKPFRKAIIPRKSENVFLFFDLKAAEFFLACLLADEKEIVKDYFLGDDIYSRFEKIFNSNDRAKVKQTVIANIYDVTPFRVSETFGVTELEAKQMLRNLQQALPNLEKFKLNVIMKARSANCYFASDMTDGFKQVKIAEVDPKEGFNHRTALSVSVQSSLGIWMQKMLKKVERKTDGTVLSVFDSMLIEVKESRVEAAIKTLQEMIVPFRASKFGIGRNFLEATNV